MSFEKDSKVWDLYHQKTATGGLIVSKYAQEKEALFPRNSVIIDLGGGVGADAMYFLEKGHSVIILDISQYALGIAMTNAKKKGFESKLIIKQVDFSLHRIPLKPATVDIAYSRLSLNYFDKSETALLLQDIFTILKPGGKAFLTFKSPDEVEEIQYLRKHATLLEENVFIDNGQIRSRFSISQLEQILKAAGIVGFEVNPYSEGVGNDVAGTQRQIVYNEVLFTKPNIS